jgi:hypothetical protein
VFLGNLLAVEITQDGFQDDANTDGKAGDGADALFLKLRQRIKAAFATRSRIEGLQRIEEIM